MSAPRISARGLGKRFRRFDPARPRTLQETLLRPARPATPSEPFWALRDVGFEVAEGEALGVVGENGSGKSTLLRLLGGVMRPDAGELVMRGRVRGLLDLGIGMHNDLTGRENILINGVIAGLSRQEVIGQLDAIIAFSELEQFVDAPVRTYSSGMRLRLGFATAVHARPDILLIDEVLSVGDIGFQRKCLDRIREFRREGCAILLITHDLEQLNGLCDQALWLRHGEVVAYGSPTVISGDYRADMDSETDRRAPAGAGAYVTPGGVALRLHENRFGSLEGRILDVSLRDADGRATHTLRSGSPLHVEIEAEADVSIDAHLCVSIGRGEMEDCLELNTDVDGLRVGDLRARRTLELKLDRLDLAPGLYDVSVGLYEPEWRYAYDYHWRAYPLTVTDDTAAQGVLAPPHKWRLT